MKIRSVPITNCVHYSAFRYGRNEYNPYENYSIQVVRGDSRESARARFVEFLQHYRPRHLGEALGCDGNLSKQYPLWKFPWDRIDPARFNLSAGWHVDPDECPDIMTHFSEAGILLHRIDEEFFWLERALRSIKRHGYRPWRNLNFVRVLTFRRKNGAEAHLLLDGNHRVSAMSALGFDSVRVYQARKPIAEDDCDFWPGVASGHFPRQDALAIFHAYFNGNADYRTAVSPVNIINGHHSHAALVTQP